MKNKTFSLIKFTKQTAAIFSAILISLAFTSCIKPGDMALQNGAQLFQQQKFDAAESCFKEALNEECSYTKDVIYIYIANCYSQRGDFDTAISYRKQAMEISKKPSSDDYNNLAMLYRLKKDDATAEQYFLKSIELSPEDPIAYVSLGGLYMTAENFDKAITYLEKAEDLNGTIGIIYADLSICYAKKGNFKEAEAAYDEAVKQKTENLAQFRAQLDEMEGYSEKDVK